MFEAAFISKLNGTQLEIYSSIHEEIGKGNLPKMAGEWIYVEELELRSREPSLPVPRPAQPLPRPCARDS